MSSSGRPTTRVVGIKGFDKSGFKIATNGNSVKAKQMVKPSHCHVFYLCACIFFNISYTVFNVKP